MPSPKLDLFILRDFLDGSERAALCALIDANRRPSTLADDLGIARFRTSETCDLDPRHPLVRKVQQCLSDLTNIPLSHAEPLQGRATLLARNSGRTPTASILTAPTITYITAEAGQRSGPR